MSTRSRPRGALVAPHALPLALVAATLAAVRPLPAQEGAADAVPEVAPPTSAEAVRVEPVVEPTVAQATEPLVVAVRQVPPFSMRDSAGNWDGLSIALWQDVADRLDLEFDWLELPLAETLAGLEDGSVDVAVTALTVSADREARFDFAHPYHVGGATLAYRSAAGSPWLATVRSFFSRDFLTAIGSLSLVLLAAGAAVWLFERRRNREQFDPSPVRGLGDGFWWSAVTMTTVGYGDKAPATLGGRAVGLVWMFMSMIIVASFTAAIAASLTTNRLAADLLTGRGLSELSVAVLEGSTSETLANDRGARVRPYPTLDEALEAVRTEAVDAVLHDGAVLAHRARTDADWLQLAPRHLARDDYAFGLPQGSVLREPVNGAQLSILPEPTWQAIVRRYLGGSE